jgi:hypothetical protein
MGGTRFGVSSDDGAFLNVSVPRVSGDQHVVADSFIANSMQPDGISHLGNALTSETWFVSTGEQGSDKTPDLVYQLQIT